MIDLREHWQGVSLPGDYTLEQWVGGDDNAAFFQTSLATDGRRAVVKLVPEAALDSAAQLDLWHRTRQLRHPNLLELLDFGRADLSGEIVLYAVFEAPDDTLASAIQQSPLTQPEAREVLDAVLGGLRYLHQQSLAIGTLDPDHIVAVGDRIKLSTDALREAAGPSACAEDIRALGGLWHQALMPASARSAEIAAHAADPDPQSRWTLAEITAALNPAVAPPPAKVAPAAAAAPAATVVAAAKEPPALPPPHDRATKSTPPYGIPKWILVATGAILLLILGSNLRRPAEVASQPAATSPATPPVTLPATTPAPAPERKAAEPVAPKPSALAGKEMWRVIAFTYHTRDAAEKKVRQLNQHHPDLHAAVFTPREKRGYYLVSLGGRMTHEQATRLQHSARGRGLPRDLYVQNYLD